jgi:hypothetical protein
LQAQLRGRRFANRAEDFADPGDAEHLGAGMHRLHRLLKRRDIAGSRRLVDIGDKAGGVGPEIVDQRL